MNSLLSKQRAVNQPLKRRIRILLTIPDFVGSGAVRELRNLVDHLPRSCFEPHVCIWRRVFDLPPRKDVPIHVVPKTRPWHGPSAIHGLARLVKRLQPDLVFSQTFFQSVLTGTALALLRRPPAWICRLPNNPYYELPFPMCHWARWSLARANRIVGCSNGVSRALSQCLRLDVGRVVTLVNLVDLQEILRQAEGSLPTGKSRRRFTIVHAGRFHRQKNQTLLLEAFRRFRGRPAELWLLGQGPLRNGLESLAHRLGVNEQIRWLGYQPSPYRIFKAADCFALSSIYEGMPNTLIESMASGTPVVSTAAPYGPDELIRHGDNGLLTRVNDVAGLGEALEYLADSPTDRLRMGRVAAEDMLTRFDLSSVLDRYLELFHEVASRNEPGPC